MKRLVISLTAVMALLVSAGTTIAAGNGAVVETIPMTFAPLTSETCPYLPDGTSITWSGTGQSVTRTRTDKHGITTIGNSTIARGVATDQDRNEYHFLYSASYRISNTVANPGLFSGHIVDSFTLAGNGPAKLANGFVGTFTTDGTSSSFQAFISWGDPISFGPFPQPAASHCDPL